MINGIILVDKPKNVTSRDVVNEVGKVLKTKKIGHTGTLDPIATGLLILTVGKATKLTDLITSDEKEYIADCILGIETDTLDVTGNIIKEENIDIAKEKVVEVLNSFIGEYEQEVPIYSAVKINGKKLYEYARNNEKVDLPKRNVEIKKIKLLDYKNLNGKVNIKFSCLVSKGTYIRSLIRDIAYKLNTVGVMKELRRTKQGKYLINDSFTLENIKNNNFKFISLKDVLNEYYTVKVDEKLKFKIINGQIIDNIYNQDYVLFIDEDVLGLYIKDNDKLKPYKMFL